MARKKPVEWSRLDNAAKIFPPTTNSRDTKVFRLASELKDEVEQGLLQDALNQTLELFPMYRMILRRGVFWYYFESTDLVPVVRKEDKVPCSMLYHPSGKKLLFEVTYYKNRINLEVYHALTDGTGALAFMKTLLYFYITSKYQEEFTEGLPVLDYDASVAQRMDDSFLKHYTGVDKQKKVKLRKAYRITGKRTIDNRTKVIEGTMSVKEVLAIAHRYNTTMTIYLTALFIKAILEDMPSRSKKYPIVLSVPVNLRAYFPSMTARNFFATISIRYDCDGKENGLPHIIEEVKRMFQNELTEEKLRKLLNRLGALEHNASIRIVPLALKDQVLKLANFINDRGITATLSNVGKINTSKEFSSYIHLFSCFTSARRPQICMCSFGDQLVVSFTSPFMGTDIQKNFYRMLSSEGVGITVDSNMKEV